MAATAKSEASAATSRPPECIASRDNQWLKRFRAALAGDTPKSFSGNVEAGNARAAAAAPDSRSSRSGSEGEIAGIEGARLVETALAIAASGNGMQIVAVLSSDSGAKHFARLTALVPSGARVLHTTDRLFDQIAGTQTPQGIAALVRPRTATLDELVIGVPLILVLAGVQDPGNVGVLARAAEAFGATGAAACAAGGIGTANPFGPKALRASAGAALRLPIVRCAAAPVLLAQLRVAGVRVIAACPEDAPVAAMRRDSAAPSLASEHRGTTATWESSGRKAAAPWEIDWRGATALLVGNEGAGLPAELIRSADQIVAIPQANRGSAGKFVDSLNAGVAGGVLLYEAARQRSAQ